MADQRTDVLVVGAGPTGLMLANCLAKLGIDAILVDGKSGPTRESRALGVQARTMELYDQLAMAETVLAHATPAPAIVWGYEDHALPPVRLPDLGAELSPYPRLYVLEQSRNEQLLVENLGRLGRSVRWNSWLKELRLGGGTHPVEAVFDTGTVRARYCVGADGTSSTVRKLVGIPFEGETNPYNYYVLDALGVRGLVADCVNIRVASVDFLLSFPMGSGAANRLLGVLRQSEADGQHGGDTTEERVRQRVQAVFGVSYDRSRWFSTYKVHHRVAAAFRESPVFLAGDAAHVHSPVGAQGMNTGMQDAHNLAIKLADVLAGRASDGYLDRYEAERRPVALRLVRTTDRLFGAVTSEHPLPRFVRTRIAPVAAPLGIRIVPRLPFASRLFSYVSQTRIHYWMFAQAKKAAHGRRGRIVGRRLQWTGENFECLRSMTWQIHGYSETLRPAAQRIARELGIDAVVFASPGFSRLNPKRLYLVRPDGFVAAAGEPENAAAEFSALFERVLR
jgi:2-polyprenyl-6-methoxyphenol hydroxylase-like FAD-dependent oxidoreductase